jgi:hypothetical protein
MAACGGVNEVEALGNVSFSYWGFILVAACIYFPISSLCLLFVVYHI